MPRIYCLLLILLLAGCSRHTDRREPTAQFPADSGISREQMVMITADIHYLEAILLKKHINKKENKNLSAYYYDELYLKYGISKMRYHQNLVWLQKDAKDFLSFYNSVLRELENRIDSTQRVLKKSAGKK